MSVPRLFAVASAIGLAGLSLACDPFRAAVPIGVQPSPSPVSVALSVRKASCSERVTAGRPGEKLVEAIVAARIDNRSTATVMVHRGAFRLVTPNEWASPNLSGGRGYPLVVPAGESRMLHLLFSTHGGISCVRPMRLEAVNAATQGSQTVHLPPVTFRLGPS